MGSDAWTAIGTLALAAVTVITLITTIIITVQDRRRADAGSRRDRLLSDAVVIAEVEQLLVDLYPPRCDMSAARGRAEDATWARLYGDIGKAEAWLRALAVSHSSETVRSQAKELPPSRRRRCRYRKRPSRSRLVPSIMAGSLVSFAHVPVTLPVHEIVSRLNRLRPDAVFRYPSMLARLAAEQQARRLAIAPKFVNCVAETLLRHSAWRSAPRSARPS